MKYPVSWNLVISRRYLYTHRLILARIHSLVAQCADILRVRCYNQPIAATINGGCCCGV